MEITFERKNFASEAATSHMRKTLAAISMKHTINYAILLGFIGLTSCADDSISMIDYYYPLSKTDEFIVYEYDRTDKFDQKTDSSKLYYKVQKIDENRFSVASLDERLFTGDSLVLSIDNDAIAMEEYYEIYSTEMQKSKSPKQILYPSRMRIGDQHLYTLTFDADDSERYHTEKLTYTSILESVNNGTVTLEVRSNFEQIGIKDNDNSSNIYESHIEFQQNTGMVRLIAISKTFETAFELIRTWEPKEWKKKTAANNG